jgi:amidophosphoribosyltransferase
MSGFFGCVSRNECVNEVFYGTDYHSHLGTNRAGMAFVKDGKFVRSIHSLEDGYFRNKFESELPRFEDSNMGVGVISDSESQPITITSHVGRYAVVTVARIDNLEELTAYCAKRIDPSHWLGMMQTTWERIDKDWMHVHKTALRSIENTSRLYDSL